MTLPNKPVSARIQWTWQWYPEKGKYEEKTVQGWLTLYPNGVSFTIQDDPNEYAVGLPRVDHPFNQAQFEKDGGKILQWVDY